MNKRRIWLPWIVLPAVLSGQVTVPEGTKVRLRLEQTLSSGTAEQGQPVQLSVTEDVRVDDTVVVAQGAGATGSIVLAVPKRRMGRTGKLDFSIDRVATLDGASIPLRYSTTKREGDSHTVRSGVLAAGAAVIFWPAAPVFLLMKGKDVTVNRGTIFEVFTDQKFVLRKAAAARDQPEGQSPPAEAHSARLTVASEPLGGEVSLDGAFVGNTPATLQVTPGMHMVLVQKSGKKWERQLHVQPGSSVSLIAVLQ